MTSISMLADSGVSPQVYDIPPSSVKVPVFSVPVGEIKPQGVYDIPPSKGVSELLQKLPQARACVCVCVCECAHAEIIQRGKTCLCVQEQGGKGSQGGRRDNKDNCGDSIFNPPPRKKMGSQ